MNNGLARDVSLHLGLVCPVDDGPAHRSPNCDGPESVTSQWVHVEAGGVKSTLRLNFYSLIWLFIAFLILASTIYTVQVNL